MGEIVMDAYCINVSFIGRHVFVFGNDFKQWQISQTFLEDSQVVGLVACTTGRIEGNQKY